MEMPASFEDGDCNNFQSYICRHAIFPDYALKRGIHGEAVVQFVVSDSGVVIMPKILTSIDKDINMELVRVMEAAPRWKPGKQSGRSVYEQFIIPIQFDINPESNDSIISHNNKSKPVEKDAIFHGGDINTFRTWVAEHVHFPESAIDMPLEGRIIVKFVVNPLGIVEDVKIIKGVDPDLDKEVEKTILSSPKWIPAKQGG